MLSASDWGGRQEAFTHVQVLWGEEVILCCGSDMGRAGLRLTCAFVEAGEDGEFFLLCPKVKSVRWRAELRDISGSVSYRRADEGGQVP